MTEPVTSSSSVPVRASGEPQEPTSWTIDGSMPLPFISGDFVRRQDVAAMWNAWRCGLPADAPFRHSDGVAFLNKLNEIPASASHSDDGARQPQDEAWQIMHRIYRKVCEMTVGLPMPTTAFYDFGVPIIAEELAALRARIVVLETSVDSLSYLIDHPVKNETTKI